MHETIHFILFQNVSFRITTAENDVLTESKWRTFSRGQGLLEGIWPEHCSRSASRTPKKVTVPAIPLSRTGVFSNDWCIIHYIYIAATVKALEACEAPLLANECVANKSNALYQALLAFTYNSDVDAFINAFCRYIVDWLLRTVSLI